jgi:UDP-2,3-diacylglucosamine hydrolase
MSFSRKPLPFDIELRQAPPDWRVLDFISDLHLQSSEEATFQAWKTYMENNTADAVFILGDLFEVWIGDDALGNFENACLDVLKQATARQAVFFLHGNRDFLLGAAFAAGSGITLLPDPVALEFGGKRWLLTHGDALCLGDVDYQHFRTLVRSMAWQRNFLAQSVPERQRVAGELRAGSARRKAQNTVYADADSSLAQIWLSAAKSAHLIHGHTHRPGDSALGIGYHRSVLSDWDLGAPLARAQVLRLVWNPEIATPPLVQRLSPAQAC